MVVLVLMLLFSFSRSEAPLPQTQSSFSLEKNASVADVRVLTWEGRLTVQLRLKVIKQDPRMQRPEAAGNDDWVVMGDVADDPQFSVAAWLRLLFSFHGSSRGLAAPFFVRSHTDRETPLTYGRGMTQFRGMLARVVSPEEAKTYGLHSMRVSGWNGARRGPAGEELAIAQGGWHLGSQSRYDRFKAQEICDLPHQILEGADEALPTSARIASASHPPPPPPPPPASRATPTPSMVSSRKRRVPRPAEVTVSVEELAQFVTEQQRPSARRPPTERGQPAG